MQEIGVKLLIDKGELSKSTLEKIVETFNNNPDYTVKGYIYEDGDKSYLCKPFDEKTKNSLLTALVNKEVDYSPVINEFILLQGMLNFVGSIFEAKGAQDTDIVDIDINVYSMIKDN